MLSSSILVCGAEIVVIRSVSTNETFSKRDNNKSYSNDGRIYFTVYRFEIERGRQIAGNIFSGVIGTSSTRTPTAL